MLSSILSKSDCAQCKFCCSFKRTSLWETPVFEKELVQKLCVLYPQVKFVPSATGNSFTYDISSQYKTDDPAEEAPCPFLDTHKGCILPPEDKPFDCKIWPLRAVRPPSEQETTLQTEKLAVALTPTCPAINKQPLQKVRDLAASGLGKAILDYAQEHPDIIKDYSEFLSTIVYSQES